MYVFTIAVSIELNNLPCNDWEWNGIYIFFSCFKSLFIVEMKDELI